MSEQINSLSLSEELFELRIKFLHKLSLRVISPKISETEIREIAKNKGNDEILTELRNHYSLRRKLGSLFGFFND